MIFGGQEYSGILPTWETPGLNSRIFLTSPAVTVVAQEREDEGQDCGHQEDRPGGTHDFEAVEESGTQEGEAGDDCVDVPCPQG